MLCHQECETASQLSVSSQLKKPSTPTPLTNLHRHLNVTRTFNMASAQLNLESGPATAVPRPPTRRKMAL